jgi:excisionase family DNA binding protein
VDDRLIDIDALALYLDLSKNTIYDWRKRGQGPAAFKLGKHLRWRLSEVDAWLED